MNSQSDILYVLNNMFMYIVIVYEIEVYKIEVSRKNIKGFPPKCLESELLVVIHDNYHT